MSNKSPELDFGGPPADSLLSHPVEQPVVKPEAANEPQPKKDKPAYSPGGLQIPGHFKDELTPERRENIQKRVNDQAFTNEASKMRELGADYISSSPPEVPSGHLAQPTELASDEERLIGAREAKAMYEKMQKPKPPPQPTDLPLV